MPNLRKLRPNQAACPAAGTQSLTPWDMDHPRSLPKSSGMKSYKSLQVSGQKRMQYIKFIPQSRIYKSTKNQKFQMEFFRILPRNAAWFSWWSTRVHSVRGVGGGLCGTCLQKGGCKLHDLKTDSYHIFETAAVSLPSPLTDVRIDFSQFNWICWLLCYLDPSSTKSKCNAGSPRHKVLQWCVPTAANLKLLKVGKSWKWEAQGAAVSPTSLHRLCVGGDSAGGGSGGSETSLSGTTEAWDCHSVDECWWSVD